MSLADEEPSCRRTRRTRGLTSALVDLAPSTTTSVAEAARQPMPPSANDLCRLSQKSLDATIVCDVWNRQRRRKKISWAAAACTLVAVWSRLIDGRWIGLNNAHYRCLRLIRPSTDEKARRVPTGRRGSYSRPRPATGSAPTDRPTGRSERIDRACRRTMDGFGFNGRRLQI